MIHFEIFEPLFTSSIDPKKVVGSVDGFFQRHGRVSHPMDHQPGVEPLHAGLISVCLQGIALKKKVDPAWLGSGFAPMVDTKWRYKINENNPALLH